MKKTIAFLLIVVMCFTITACSGKDSKAEPTTEQVTEAPTEAETEAPTEAETEAPTEAETEEPAQEKNNVAAGKLADKVHVEIHDAQLAKDIRGNTAIVVNYKFKNLDTRSRSFVVAVNNAAYQDGVELGNATISSDNDINYDDKNTIKSIEPGEEIDIQWAFKLKGNDPVKIELTNRFDFSGKYDDQKIVKTFTID